jgi:hypothetical protein
LFFLVCISFVTISSCDKPNPDIPDDPDDIQTDLVVSAVITDWSSVKSMPDGSGGNYKFTPAWEKGDKIIGYYNNGTGDVLMTYEVNDVAEDGTARFKKVGTFEEPKNGETVYFIYASGYEASSIANGKLAINIQNQSKRDMPMLMSASGKVLSGKLTLPFSSKMAVIGLKNPSLDGSHSMKISQLTVSGKTVIVDGTFDLKAGSFTLGEESSYINVICDHEAGSEEMIFVSLFPQAATNLEFTITQQEAFVYSLSCESMTPQANYLYYFNAPDFTRSAGYVAIDWEQDITSQTFDVTSGDVEIDFKSNVPPLKKNDVLIVPDKSGEYHIRLVSSVTQTKEGGTLSVKTTEGKMGHLFKNCKFTLSTESGVKTRSPFDRIYTPSRLEIFNGHQYIPVYDITKAPEQMSKEIFKWEKNLDGTSLLEHGPLNLSWEQCNFDVGLKGTFEFDFGEIPWEKAGMGDLQRLSIFVEGEFNMNLALKIAATASAEASKEFTLMDDIVKARFTFMVGAVPVYISVSSDLMAELSAEAEGEVSITGGVSTGMAAKFGVEWDKESGGKPIYEVDRKLELISPTVDAHAHLEGNIYTYPSIEIALYSVLCPTINPKPYIKAAADARFVDKFLGWNAGLSAGLDLELALNLDLFFIEEKLVEIEPINIFDLPLVALPDELTLKTETPTQMTIGEKKDIKYHATHKNHLTGTNYNGAGLLVHFEAEGGTLDKEYAYTDRDGNVEVSFTLKSMEEGNVKAEIVLGDGEADPIEATLWEAEIINFRLTANPTSQIIGDDGKAPVSFKLEKYTSVTGEWSPVQGQTLTFTAVGGTCPASGVTAPSGMVDIVFTAEEDFTEGSVTAEYKTNVPVVWGGSVKAEIIAKEKEDDTPEGQLTKAKKLKENVVRIGSQEVEVVKGELDYVEVVKRDDGTYYVEWCKEKYPELATIHYGRITGFTEAMFGQMIDINSPAWRNLFVGLMHITNPDAASWNDWVSVEFYSSNIVNGAVQVTRHSNTSSASTKSTTNEYYTLQFYLKNSNSVEAWANLKTTK